MDIGNVTLRASGDELKRDLELVCDMCSEHICDAEDGDTLETLARTAWEHECQTATCRHCQRTIAYVERDGWIDPEAPRDPDEDDHIWRETCDRHDTFIADHEPTH